MIDRDVRNKAIPLLIQYKRDGFSDRPLKAPWPKSSDPALSEILLHLLPKPKAKSRSHLPTIAVPYTSAEEKKATIYRCILFLESNLEYPWPAERHRYRIFSALVLLILGGLVLASLRLKMHGHIHFVVLLVGGVLNYFWARASRRSIARGNFKVWPFFASADFERERERVELQKTFGLADYWRPIEAGSSLNPKSEV